MLCSAATTTTTTTTTSTLTLAEKQLVPRRDRQLSMRKKHRPAAQHPARISAGSPQNETVLPERKWKNAFRFLAGRLCDTLRQSHTKETWEVKQVTGRCIIDKRLLRQCRATVISIQQAAEQTGTGASKPEGFSEMFGLNMKATALALLVCLMDYLEL